MKISILSLAACVAIGIAAPAFAWSDSAQAGAYRITATMAPDARRLSLAVASSDARPATVHAWFIDGDGLILGDAAMPVRTGGQWIAYNPALAVPATATAVVVMTQPGAAALSADGNPDAQVTQIALPAR